MSLTNTQAKNAKPKEKQYKLTDQGGMYILVRPNGTKTWKYDYRLNGRRLTYTIGTYPEVSLSDARESLLAAKKLVKAGVDPVNYDRKAKHKNVPFKHRCEAWLAKQNLADSTRTDLEQRIKKNLYPYMDRKAIDEYTTRDLLDILTKITDRGARETAFRMAGVLRNVFNEALILGDIDNNPATGVAELLPKPDAKKKGNFAHITDPEVFGGLLRQINNPEEYIDPVVRLALRLMPLVFLRPKNIRFLKWEQIDFDNALITIPKEEMKMHRDHKVPLSTQAIGILKEAKVINGDLPYVFVTQIGRTKGGKPISEASPTSTMRRLTNPATGQPYGTGFMTSHGFRHTASTMLNEQGYSPDAIELQMAHESQDRIRATYNKAELMPERTKMMQEWADYIDRLVRS